jgi:precorrin-2 dehydrogenase / sirohydrochlorin ferrochelatase
VGEHTPHYPVFLTLEGRLAIIVGDDAAAMRKVGQLSRYGADIVVIAANSSPELRQLEVDGVITLEPRGYVRGDLAGAFLVYCTETDEIARAVYSEAETLGCLINVADSPALSSYLVPSSVRRGQLQIAVSTSGAAPAVAKRLRRELREQFGPEWATYIALLGDVRALASQATEDPARFAAVVAASADLDFLERLAEGEEIAPEAALAEAEAVADAAADATTTPDAAPDPELAPEPATEE